MSTVALLPGAITAAQVRAYTLACSMIGEAILQAKDAGVMQGLIVSLLQGCLHRETTKMLEGVS